jgi:DNA (cytosine-5)-methyltransferase 1
VNVGSLFSGVGGMDLGLERAGMTVRWQVENDPYCQRVLAKHWPNVTRYGDIKTIDWSEVERPDLICGGFPCQPVSLAGKRLAQADERWLWPEYARCVRALRPRYVLVENVPGLASNGLGDVLGDLAALGYDTEWDCIPAAAVGAPHLRYRILIVAYRDSGGCEVFTSGDSPTTSLDIASRDDIDRCGNQVADAGSGHGRQGGSGRPEHGGQGLREHTYPDMADAQIFTQRFRLCSDESGGERGRRSGDCGSAGDLPDAEGFHVRCLDDGEPAFIGAATSEDESEWEAVRFGDWWATEPDVGRVAHGVPARVDRLRGLGNAVVPQVAEWIGRRIMEGGPRG